MCCTMWRCVPPESSSSVVVVEVVVVAVVVVVVINSHLLGVYEKCTKVIEQYAVFIL
jgi:hypothetical protein